MTITVNELPPGPGGSEEDLQEVSSYTKILREILDSTQAIILDDIKADIRELRTAYELIEGQLLGEIASPISQAKQLLSKCATKILKDVRDSTDAVLAQVYSAGMPYCTIEQMLYGLESGDYLGAMGLTEDSPYRAGSFQQVAYTEERPIAEETGCELDEDGWPLGTVSLPADADRPPDYVPIIPTTEGEIVYVPEYCLPHIDPLIVHVLFGGSSDRIYDRSTREIVYVPVGSVPPEPPIPKEPSKTETPTQTPERVVERVVDRQVIPQLVLPDQVPEGQREESGAFWRWFAEDLSLRLVESKQTQIREFLALWHTMDWSNLNVCPIAAELKSRMPGFTQAAFELLKTMARELVSQWESIAIRNPAIVGGAGTQTGLSGVVGTLLTPAKDAISRAAVAGVADVVRYGLDSIISLAQWTLDGISTIASTNRCNFAEIAPVIAIKYLLDFISKWTGVEFRWITRPIDQWIQYCCPTELPTVPEVQRLYLGDEIDRYTHDCLIEANAFFASWSWLSTHNARTKPGVHELGQLYLRKEISREQYLSAMRAEGVLEREDLDRFTAYLKAWPGISDIISFLVRDVADEKLVKDFGMDFDFQNKWQGDLIKYAEGLGIPTELAKYYWRAHWRLPSPTQLYEMVHRLRPGRVPQDIETTIPTAKTALQQDDVLPYWIDRLLAVAYQPITRTDAQRAYEIGAFTLAQLKDAYLDIGYNERDADLLVSYSTKLVDTRRKRKVGLPTGRDIINRYVNGSITADEFRLYLKDLGYTDPEIQEALKWAGRRIRSDSNKAQIACIKKRHDIGLLSTNEAKREVYQIVEDDPHTEYIVDAWCVAKKAQGKEVSSADLCAMFTRNLIDARTFQVALVNNGYSLDRAEAIIKLCITKAQEAQAKATKTELEKARKEREKQAKEAEKRAKEAKKEAEKQAKEEGQE